MKKFFVSFLIICFVLSGLSPVLSVKKAEANPLFVVAAAFSVVQSVRDLTRTQNQENPPTIWLGSDFSARVNQPEIGMPDESGWRKVVFPYNLHFTVKIGYIVKFWNGKSTDYVSFGGDVVKLKKGEPVWVKMTSSLQEIIDQAGTSVVNNPVVLAPLTQPAPPPPVQLQAAMPTPTPPRIVSNNDAIDITTLPVTYLYCGGYNYRGKLVRVYISSATKVDWWDHLTQSAKVAHEGDTIFTGELTWFK